MEIVLGFVVFFVLLIKTKVNKTNKRLDSIQRDVDYLKEDMEKIYEWSAPVAESLTRLNTEYYRREKLKSETSVISYDFTK